LVDDSEQVAEYHKQASALGFDVLITISNEPAQPGGGAPRGLEVAIDGRRARRCPVVHMQWRDLLGDAQSLIDDGLEENVEDTDQAWMLEEWIRYVTDDGSGILERASLGQHWSAVLEDAAKSKLDRRSDQLHDVIAHWMGYFGEIGYHLRLLGIHATPRVARKERTDPELLRRRLCDECEKSGMMIAEWKVPGPVDVMRCGVHLGHRKIHYSFEVTEFDGKTSSSRLWTWISQLDRDLAPNELTISASWKGTRTKTMFQLRDIESGRMLQSKLQEEGIERSAEPTRLEFEWIIPLPKKKGQQGIAHLEAITAGMVRFYDDVAAGLRSVERMPASKQRRQPAAADQHTRGATAVEHPSAESPEESTGTLEHHTSKPAEAAAKDSVNRNAPRSRDPRPDGDISSERQKSIVGAEPRDQPGKTATSPASPTDPETKDAPGHADRGERGV